MLARSNSVTLSIPANNFVRADYRPMPRSREPEFFTFEQVSAAAPQRNTWVRPRRKTTRVMYPAKVRKYLPPPEKSPAKRWLLILCLVVFLQIYTEEASVETATPSATDKSAEEAAIEDLSFPPYQLMPFQSAEQQARQMRSLPAEDPQQEQQQVASLKSILSRLLNWTCPCRDAKVTNLCEESRRNSYVLAFLYPVYHKLGSEK